MSVLRKVLGNAVVLAHSRGQRRASFRPVSRWAADRDRRIAATVRYAARTVPYYERFFAERGIDPRRIRTPREMNSLPLLDKATVRRDPDAFVSQSWRGRSSIPFVTSGSTGAPLRVHHDLVSLLANIAYGEREPASRGTPRGRAPRIASFTRDASTGSKVRRIYRRWTYVPGRPERLRLGVDRPFTAAIEEINRFRPDVISGYGSYLEALFRFASEKGVEIHRPECVRYFSEGMSLPGRRLISEEIGIPVFSGYNAIEAFKIGFMCAEGVFHVHADLCLLRVLDEAGADARPGEPGEIVISNLVNRGSVLLNYRLGDIGVLVSESCPCGRTFPVLTELQGRKEDLLPLGPDRVVHPRAVWNVLESLPGIVQYRLIQHDRSTFTLEIVASETRKREWRLTDAVAGLRELLGQVEIDARFAEGPLTGQGGKFRPVISHYRS